VWVDLGGLRILWEDHAPGMLPPDFWGVIKLVGMETYQIRNAESLSIQIFVNF
jgi:hypothetical protein